MTQDPYNLLTRQQYELRCRKCASVVSSPIRELGVEIPLQFEDDKPVLPPGHFIRSERLLAARADEPTCGHAEVIVDRSVLVHAVEGGNRIGCCGPSGTDGYNLFCPRKHPIGTEVGDCWQCHFVHLPLTLVDLVMLKRE
jgi:hypothetical protein